MRLTRAKLASNARARVMYQVETINAGVNGRYKFPFVPVKEEGKNNTHFSTSTPLPETTRP